MVHCRSTHACTHVDFLRRWSHACTRRRRSSAEHACVFSCSNHDRVSACTALHACNKKEDETSRLLAGCRVVWGAGRPACCRNVLRVARLGRYLGPRRRPHSTVRPPCPRSLADDAEIAVSPCRWRSPPGAEPRPAPRRFLRLVRHAGVPEADGGRRDLERHVKFRPLAAMPCHGHGHEPIEQGQLTGQLS